MGGYKINKLISRKKSSASNGKVRVGFVCTDPTVDSIRKEIEETRRRRLEMPSSNNFSLTSSETTKQFVKKR